MAAPPPPPLLSRSVVASRGLTESSSARVTANVINVNEVCARCISLPFYRCPFPRLLYYPVMNTVSRVITTNASAFREAIFFARSHTAYIFIHSAITVARPFATLLIVDARLTLRISSKKSCQLAKKHGLVIRNQSRPWLNARRRL